MPPQLILPRWETPDPPRVAGTYGDAAIAWARRELGIKLGTWQQRSIRRALRHDRRGDLIHRTVLLSTARQNGKSVIVRVIFGWLLDEGHQLPVFSDWSELLAAAHDAKQARIIYSGVYRDLDSIPRLHSANRESGRFDRSVRLTEHFGVEVNGLILDTVTGQPGSSRGHSAGAIAWDEVLTQTDWDGYAALSPTQAAQRSPLMILTSTAGFIDSVVLRTFYDRLVRLATGAEKPDPTFYGAWWQSTDPDAEPGDWPQIQQANPALGDGRLTRAYISSEGRQMPPDAFRRERLNHWLDKRAEAAISPTAWAACRTPRPLRDVEGPFALGVDVARGSSRASIVVAGQRPDGRIGAEVYRDLRPTGDQPVSTARIVDEIRRFNERVVTIAYDRVLGAASAFERDAQDSLLPWDGLAPAAMMAACMDVDEMINAGQLAVDDPLLDAQAPAVVRRNVGSEGGFRFSRGLSESAIDAFMAMTLAVHAIAYAHRLPTIY